MVYVDNFYTTGGGDFGRMKMSHMIADTHHELLLMAIRIGVSTKWIQNEGTGREHFDVCMAKRKLAIKNGAMEVTFRDMARIRGLKKLARKKMPKSYYNG